MTRRRVILLAVALLLLGAIVLTVSRDREPRYQRRKLSAWLNDYYTARHYEIPDRQAIMEKSANAIKAVGTNGIPLLLNWLQATNAPFKTRFNRFLAGQHYIRFRFDLQAVGLQNDKAMDGFEILANDAMPAVPALTNLLNSPNQNLRENAMDSLLSIDNGTWVLLPLILQSLNSTNDYFKDVSAIHLIQNYPEEAEKAGVYRMFPRLRFPPK